MSDTIQDKQPIRGDGFYVANQNDLPNSVGLILSTRQASPSGVFQVLRATAITNNSDNSTSQDVALRDNNGNPYTELNPLAVRNIIDPDMDCDTDFGTKQAPGASRSHTFSPTGLCRVRSASVGASDAFKAEVLISRASGGGFVSKKAKYSTASNKNVDFNLGQTLAAGDQIRITKTNSTSVIGGTTFDIYSSIDYAY